MIQQIVNYNLTNLEWLTVVLCGMLIGMSKTGLSGLGLFVVPVMAGIFGGKPSVGLLLPMLVIADSFGVFYYNRHANWSYILKLLPWAMLGILTALIVGKMINDDHFKMLIAMLVIIGILLMIYQDLFKKKINVPNYWWFSGIVGLAGGFATMIGNAAGPIMAIYLLSFRLPKNIYIGTGAWFFFIINLSKVPLHVFVWKTITWKSFSFDLFMIIPIIAGAVAGFYLVKIIPEKPYRVFIILSTMASALVLF